jgi:hypothetical protein
MDAAAENRSANSLQLLFAGLEAGMLGVLWMLAWMGLSSILLRRSFWTPENLMATAFDRDGPIRSGFAASTISGLALYLVIYSLLGALFAFAIRTRMSRGRILLWSVAFGLAWYYLSFHGLWNSLIPLLARLHVERAAVLGHLLYGTLLSRYPVYVKRWDRALGPPGAEIVEPATQPAVETPAEPAPVEPAENTPSN